MWKNVNDTHTHIHTYDTHERKSNKHFQLSYGCVRTCVCKKWANLLIYVSPLKCRCSCFSHVSSHMYRNREVLVLTTKVKRKLKIGMYDIKGKRMDFVYFLLLLYCVYEFYLFFGFYLICEAIYTCTTQQKDDDVGKCTYEE